MPNRLFSTSHGRLSPPRSGEKLGNSGNMKARLVEVDWLATGSDTRPLIEGR
jgi:hypothetical protein